MILYIVLLAFILTTIVFVSTLVIASKTDERKERINLALRFGVYILSTHAAVIALIEINGPFGKVSAYIFGVSTCLLSIILYNQYKGVRRVYQERRAIQAFLRSQDNNGVTDGIKSEAPATARLRH